MPTMTVRFRGRFVVVYPPAGGDVHVLAINPGAHTGGPQFEQHRPFVTIRHGTGGGPRNPSFSLITGDRELSQLSQHDVLDIRGRVLTIGNGARPFTGPTPGSAETEVPSLQVLHPGAIVDPSRLKLGKPDGLISAVIVIKSGDSSAIDSERLPAKFVEFEDRRITSPHYRGSHLADRLDVVVPADSVAFELDAIRGESSGRLLADVAESDALINISNVCASGHDEEDEEFMTYYELLTNPPDIAVRLIPAVDIGFRQGCYKIATVSM